MDIVQIVLLIIGIVMALGVIGEENEDKKWIYTCCMIVCFIFIGVFRWLKVL